MSSGHFRTISNLGHELTVGRQCHLWTLFNGWISAMGLIPLRTKFLDLFDVGGMAVAVVQQCVFDRRTAGCRLMVASAQLYTLVVITIITLHCTDLI
jgi:hypothetical protein